MSASLGPWFDYTINGLVVGNIYALLAVGLALIYGVSHLINFAHGSIYMVGAYIGWLCITYLGTPLPVTLLAVVAWQSRKGGQPDLSLFTGIGLNPLLTNTLLIHALGFNTSLSFNFPSWSISAEFWSCIVFMLVMHWVDMHYQILPSLHDTHAPVQSAAQQMPSAQCVDRHSVPSTQPAPLAFLTLAPQLPLLQTAGATQSLEAARQLARQAGTPLVASQM